MASILYSSFLFRVFRLLMCVCFICVLVPPASKPSPSKRRCSDENALNVTESENKQPDNTRIQNKLTPPTTDPVVDRKPPIPPANVSPALSSALDRLAPTPTPSASKHQAVVQDPAPEPGKMSVQPPVEAPRGWDVELMHTAPPLERERQCLLDSSAPAGSGMKARLQRLAAQRNHWDGDDGKRQDVLFGVSFEELCVITSGEKIMQTNE